ncbi:2-keto-4-pentenoate hydratase [Hoyosella sp. YIM 151337]|uniref:2-keto-4-pentenoate hydratase n=1 Tax=Hoyosella sp. YIM 151337 TaxID=2992742 RepID=UPI00223655DC|nr:2-keto-4-pentenoate hydratase [Hoyosella sp. YIM 151337]MCW4355689.1 2-keto-4-pentenoate hydratase [Hoyosella sp. YIM 151337]
MLLLSQRGDAAARLETAESQRRPIAPLSESFPGMTVEDAYEIQLVNIRRKLAAGDEVRGHKVGLSAIVMQQMMGVDEPDYGHLLSSMELHEDLPVDLSRYCYPRVEVEIGFVLGADLPGEECTEYDVLAAAERVVPALELIDSRIREWRITIVDTVADNASSAGYVIGDGAPVDGLDLTMIDATLFRGDAVIAAGRSDAVLGNPATSVAWLARKVSPYGVRLRAGHLVLPGSCTRAIDVLPDSSYTAKFSGLGSVSLSFV